jgi:serine/threonine protein kinase
MPFGVDPKKIVSRNRMGLIKYPERDWAGISSEAIDLILKMTDVEPIARLSAAEALKHPWLASFTPTPNHRRTTSLDMASCSMQNVVPVRNNEKKLSANLMERLLAKQAAARVRGASIERPKAKLPGKQAVDSLMKAIRNM